MFARATLVVPNELSQKATEIKKKQQRNNILLLTYHRVAPITIGNVVFSYTRTDPKAFSQEVHLEG
jgi:hypothetical protein